MLPAVVERELRVALLRRKARSQWLQAAWVAGGITSFFMIILGAAARRSTGRDLFHFLFGLGCIGILARGLAVTADLFSEERRNGTLGLLVLTGLTPLEIFAHKLTGAVMRVAYGLLGGLPFFAIPFLAGGVSGMQFVCGLVFLANALLFCVAIGLLASVIHREGGQAQITAVAIGLVLNLAAPIALWFSAHILNRNGPLTLWVTSPWYAGYTAFEGFPAFGAPKLFWWNSVVMLSYSLAALLLAAAILQRTWREETGTRGWVNNDGKFAFFRLVSVLGRLRHRDGLPVKRRRGGLRDGRAFCWLGARDRRPIWMARGLVAAVAVFWVMGWMTYGFGKGWRRPGVSLFSSIVLHQGLNWIIAYAAGKQLAEERQNGGFEILLTTPVNVRQMLEEQRKSVAVRFRGIWGWIWLLDLVFMCSPFTEGSWDASGVTGYVLAWGALLFMWFGMQTDTAVRGMWISTWTGRPAYAALQAMKPNFWVLFWIFMLWSGPMGRHPQDHPVYLGICSFFLLFVGLGMFKNKGELMDKLAKELRFIACAPIPARGDKRFKSWNSKRIYPPGRWGYWELRAAGPRVKSVK